MARIAVVGLGYWGPNLVRNFAAHPEVEELWICDRNVQRLEHTAARFPSAKRAQDYREILDTDVDGVVLATPVSTHYELGMEALGSGKHVFVEKPLALSVVEAERLVERAEQVNRVLMVGHTFAYSPPVLKVRDLIRAGELGQVFFVSSMRVNLGIHQRDVSVIWDLAAHDFSILFTWFDERPCSISAVGNAFVQRDVPDVAFISASFPSGMIAHIEVSWLAPSKLRRTTVVGDKKMAVYDDTETLEKVKIYDRGVDYRDPESFGEFQLAYRTGDILSPQLKTYEPLAAETREFVHAIARGTKTRSDGQSGLHVVMALAAAQRSLERGGEPISLTGPPTP